MKTDLPIFWDWHHRRDFDHITYTARFAARLWMRQNGIKHRVPSEIRKGLYKVGK